MRAYLSRSQVVAVTVYDAAVGLGELVAMGATP